MVVLHTNDEFVLARTTRSSSTAVVALICTSAFLGSIGNPVLSARMCRPNYFSFNVAAVCVHSHQLIGEQKCLSQSVVLNLDVRVSILTCVYPM